MKRITLVTFVVSILSLICLPGPSTQTGSPARQKTTETTVQRPKIILAKTVATQQRLNRYFHGQVIPKLKNCWSRLQGRGTIEIEHVYTRDARGNWTADKLTVGTSNLPREQVQMALQCMQDSVSGSSFPADGEDGKGNRYLVNWTWPVPFPVDAAKLTTAMFASKPKGGGGGGCDGYGTLAKCFTCATATICKKVCVGYKNCSITYSDGKRVCTESESCASGGPFGLGGGTVMQ